MINDFKEVKDNFITELNKELEVNNGLIYEGIKLRDYTLAEEDKYNYTTIDKNVILQKKENIYKKITEKIINPSINKTLCKYNHKYDIIYSKGYTDYKNDIIYEGLNSISFEIYYTVKLILKDNPDLYENIILSAIMPKAYNSKEFVKVIEYKEKKLNIWNN